MQRRATDHRRSLARLGGGEPELLVDEEDPVSSEPLLPLPLLLLLLLLLALRFGMQGRNAAYQMRSASCCDASPALHGNNSVAMEQHRGLRVAHLGSYLAKGNPAPH